VHSLNNLTGKEEAAEERILGEEGTSAGE